MSAEDRPGVDSLDEVIHGRLRLGVMAYLSAVNPASFVDLAKQVATTNGNLSTHLTRLENAGYVRQEKGFKGKRPQTLVHLTQDGRKAWIRYLATMKQLLATANG